MFTPPLLPNRTENTLSTFNLWTKTPATTKTTGNIATHSKYVTDPAGYFRDILRVHLWSLQQQIAEALLEPPYRVLVASGHSVGKTYCAAACANWWYDTHNPGAVISTAPREKDVKELLWGEIRLQRKGAGLGGGMSPIAPHMQDSENHYAMGFTAQKGESFQGRHVPSMLFIMDECTGVDPHYWVGAASMWKPEPGFAWLGICNPIDTTSYAYLQWIARDANGDPTWRLFSMNALEHPNILAELAGEEPPIPAAVTARQVDMWINDFGCTPITEDQKKVTDVLWRGQWYRPSPLFNSRARGWWPTEGTQTVWNVALFDACLINVCEPSVTVLPQVGCDVAVEPAGDWTTVHGRWGNCSMLHESGNGWPVPETARQCMAASRELARIRDTQLQSSAARTDPKQIPIVVDDDGVGGGVTGILREEGWNVTGIKAGTKAFDQTRYRLRRSELWFTVAERAADGGVDLSRLKPNVRERLRKQLCAAGWDLDKAGRREVMPKKDMKELLGRSPDDADGMNLAYYPHIGDLSPTVVGRDKPELHLGVHAQEDELAHTGNAAGSPWGL